MMREILLFFLLLLAWHGTCQDCTNFIGDTTCESLKPQGYCTILTYKNTYCYKTCNPSVCDPASILCTNLPQVMNGFNQPSGTSHNVGIKVYYACNAGYHLVGNSYNECLDDLTWKYAAPECMEECPQPPMSDELSIDSNPPLINNSVIVYKCKENGAETVGEATSTCVDEGGSLTWTLTELPTCNSSRACPPPPAVSGDGTDPEQRNYAHGEEATYQCDQFRELVGEATNECDDGEWKYPAPHCVAVCRDEVGLSSCQYYIDNNYCNRADHIALMMNECRKTCGFCTNCSAAPTTEFVQVSASGPFLQGDNVTYSCEFGTLVGSRINVCAGDDEWVFPAPVCNRDCVDMPTIEMNGGNNPPGDSHPHGQVVNYTCNPGYFLLPPLDNTCMNNDWSEEEAGECVKICNDPPLPDFLELVSPPDPILEGVNVTFRCGLGVLEGDNFASCNETGEWGDLPTCNTNCTDPPEIAENGYHEPDLSTYANGQVIEYKCDDGYFLLPPTMNTCNYTEWTEDTAATCIKICDDLPDLDVLLNYDIPDPVLTGVVIEFNCSNGDLVGPSNASCNATGDWSELPTCTANCGSPPNDGNFTVSDSGMAPTEGQTVEYKCLMGQTIGNSTSECLPCAEWSLDEFPQCVPIGQCGIPLSNEELTFSPMQDVYENNTDVVYSCADDTDIFTGDNITTCMNGTWSLSQLPDCINVCNVTLLGGPTVTNNATDLTAIEGAVITFSCPNPDETLIGVNMAICTGDGWDVDTPPYCQIVCDPPPTNGDTTFSPDKPFYENNEVVNYTCTDSHSVILTESQSTCNVDTWSLSQAPACTKTCDSPPSGIGLTILPIMALYVEGDNVTYECSNPNDVISGETLSTCTSGMWSLDPLPTCETGCGPPPGLTNGMATVGSAYVVGAVANYSCNSGFIKTGTDDQNTCLGTGLWEYTTVTLVQCKSAKFLYIFDGNDKVDDCSVKANALGVAAPFLRSYPETTPANFPNFFRQLDLAESIGDWLASAAGSQYAIHQHSGGCVQDNDPVYSELTFPETDYTSAIANADYECQTFGLIGLLNCAITYHYGLGGASEENVTLLVVEDMSHVLSTVIGFTLSQINGQRPNWGTQFYTMTLVPSGSADYMTNKDFLIQITCGTGETTCNRFLGSVDSFTDQEIIDKIATFQFQSTP